MAKDFVRGCTNKIPAKRPTYAALLQHPWLASLSKPITIAEVAEEEEEGEAADKVAEQVGRISLHSGTEDDEVADWVKGVLLKKATTAAAASSSSSGRPALHAAPLDSVSPLASPV